MVGILSGAVTNTPGLGAAQQANSDLTGIDAPEIALGYAVAYPLGVVGCIMSLLGLKYLFRINTQAGGSRSRTGTGTFTRVDSTSCFHWRSVMKLFTVNVLRYTSIGKP